MNAIFEYNEWFVAAMNGDDECDQEEKEEEPSTSTLPRRLQDSNCCPPIHHKQVMRTSLLPRSPSFYDTEACANVTEIEDEESDGEDDPSLTDTITDSSEEDLSTTSNSVEDDCACPADATMITSRHRRLTFHPEVTIREYSITIGDHPLCNDALPLSLDWSHAPEYCTDLGQSKSRGNRYQPPRILCLQERRQRLVQVSNCAIEMLNALQPPTCTATNYFELSLAKRMLHRLQQSLLHMERRLLDVVSMEIGVEEDEEVNEDYVWRGEVSEDELDEVYREKKDDFLLVWEENL